MRHNQPDDDGLGNYLAGQAHHAVATTVESIGRADRASNGAMLAQTPPGDVYDAAVTVVMRLIFMAAAEQRHLLPDTIGRITRQLTEYVDKHGEDKLAGQTETFPLLLAAFRALHDANRSPASATSDYGVSLFDSRQYPWLENGHPRGGGRATPVDDLAVWRILTCLTCWQGRPLNYRLVDPTRIGYMYETLLDHTAARADRTTVVLRGPKQAEVDVSTLQAQAASNVEQFTAWTARTSGLPAARVTAALNSTHATPGRELALLAEACEGNVTLVDALAPYFGLLHVDDRTGLPTVRLEGAWHVATTTRRADSGSYFTPLSLAEEVVKHTLDGLIYQPGPLHTLNENEWRIVTPDTILKLSIADIACGAGVFLIAAERYLADRLIEAIIEHHATNLNGEQPTDPALRNIADLLETGHRGRAVRAARHLTAARCLHGADINPIAVAITKLCLWLDTATLGQSISFLDHRFTAADSLLGVTSGQQLARVHPHPDSHTTPHRHIQSALTSPNPPLADLELVADTLTAATLTATTATALRAALNSAAATANTLLDPATPADDKPHLRASLHALRQPVGARRPLHWPLRHPHTLLPHGGFDAIVGNPPFLGGQNLSGTLGADYRNHLVHGVAAGRRGSADLAVYFLLTAAALTRTRIGLITTNSVAQGDSRHVGLDHLTGHGWQIVHATRSTPWPHPDATVEYSIIILHHTPHDDPDMAAPRILDGTPVRAITPDLRAASRATGTPRRLPANRGIAHMGSFILGTGFTLTEHQAQTMIEADPRNSDVLFPYLTGKDLNTSPTFQASRWVINFFDWDEQRARTYPLPFAHIEQHVKPQRDTLNTSNATGRRRRQFWWQYGGDAKTLYRKLAHLDRAIVIAQVSSTLQPARVHTRQVLSLMLAVFASDDPALLGVVASSVHGEWVRKYASSMRADVRYTPSDVFATFPLPDLRNPTVAAAADAVEQARAVAMGSRNLGLTATYKLVNDPVQHGDDVIDVRAAHIALDCAVLDAYGWGDLDPRHGFFETEQGTRFTMMPQVTVEVLDRLLELNHARHGQPPPSGGTAPQ